MTLTAANAILTTTASANVNPAGVFTAAAETVIGGVLADTAFLSDVTANDGDVLNATISSAAALANAAPTWQGIETINLTTNMTDADSISFTSVNAADAPVINAIETINLTSFGGGLDMTGVTSNTKVAVQGAGANISNLLNNVSDVVEIGNTFTGTLTLGAAAVGAGFLNTNAATATVVTTNMNAITIANTGATTLTTGNTFSNQAATTVTVTGSGTLNLGTLDTQVTTVNGATSAVGITAIASATGATSIYGGSGVDVLTAGGANDVLVGNAGADTLNGGGLAGTLRGGADADTIALGAVGKVQTVQFEATAANNGVDTITGFQATANEDVLDFSLFRGAISMNTAAADATAGDLNLATNNTGVMYNKATLAAADIVTVATATNGEVIMADNAKAVVLVSSVTDATTAATWNIYYVEDTNIAAGAQTWAVTLVGTVSGTGTTAGNMDAAAGYL